MVGTNDLKALATLRAVNLSSILVPIAKPHAMRHKVNNLFTY